MAKTPETIVAPAAQPTEFAQSLDEFCTALSLKEPRYTVIGAFHYVETKAGRVKDLPSAYAKRYADFKNTPIK